MKTTSPPSMAATWPPRTQREPSFLSEPQKVREDRIRRRAGVAWARVQASNKAIGAALRCDPSNISHFKNGHGPFAAVLLQVDACARAGIDLSPLFDAMLDVDLSARAEVGQCVDPRAIAAEYQATDSAEDLAKTAYLAGRGTLREWLDSLIAEIGAGMRAARLTGGVS